MTMYKSFETERLLIKPTSESDAAFFFELSNSPKWIKNIGSRNIKSITDAEKYITKRMTPQLLELGYSNYTLIRKRDNEKLGICGLYNRESIIGIDLGFALLPQHEGFGYAFESASKLINVAHSVFNIKLLSAITLKNNTPSISLLKKLGFTYEDEFAEKDNSERLLVYKISLVDQ